MALTPGTKLGPFEILAPLGAGGMGEVVRARDTRLGRDVAIKSLPEAFAKDPERLARFEREARLLASLSHPNVAGIHGLELVEGQRYLVLEFIEGESLAQRLARGPLSVGEAVAVCRQVAAGLEAAHEAGVIHRDLKPGNVMIRPDGDVKVLDFGLAKGSSTDGNADPNLSASPTMTYAMTTAGMILGTAAYMSPEQARGKSLDRRTDIWSFGCVLYECLTGKQAFAGETVSDVIARILQTEPDWAALPAATPRRVRDLLKRCLQRDARERQRDIGDVRLELGLPAEAADTATGARRRPAREPWIAAGACALIAIAAVAALVLRPAGSPHGPMNLAVELAPGLRVDAAEPNDVLISPDGEKLAIIARDTSGVRSLGLRHLSRDETRLFANTDGAWQPFWSPDSRSIGYFANGKLYKLSVETGSIQELCAAPLPRGAAWGKDWIVLQPRSQGPLMKLPEAGGTLSPATVLVPTPTVSGHRFPSFLPDGKHFVYAVIPGSANNYPIGYASLDDPKGRIIGGAESGPVFAAPGYLLFLKGSAVCAQRIDPSNGRLTGAPLAVPGLRPIAPNASGGRIVNASGNGILVQHDAQSAQRLHLVDRAGNVSAPLSLPTGIYTRFQYSHDGRRLAMEYAANSATSNMIWIVDLAREAMIRMTFDGGNYTPAWSPDDRRIVLSREVASSGRQEIWELDADSPGSVRHLMQTPATFNSVLQVLPDGHSALLRCQGTDTQQDIMLAVPGGAGAVRPLVATQFNEPLASVSPDGRTLAYLSDESGRMEIYARSFPSLSGQRAVSMHGVIGDETASRFYGKPYWRADGREMVFMDADGRTVMSVDVTPGDPAQFGTPHALFRLPRGAGDFAAGPNLDHFVISLEDESVSSSVNHLIVDWTKLVESAK